MKKRNKREEKTFPNVFKSLKIPNFRVDQKIRFRLFSISYHRLVKSR